LPNAKEQFHVLVEIEMIPAANILGKLEPVTDWPSIWGRTHEFDKCLLLERQARR